MVDCRVEVPIDGPATIFRPGPSTTGGGVALYETWERLVDNRTSTGYVKDGIIGPGFGARTAPGSDAPSITVKLIATYDDVSARAEAELACCALLPRCCLIVPLHAYRPAAARCS